MVMSTRANRNLDDQGSPTDSDPIVETVRDRNSPSNSTLEPEGGIREDTEVQNLEHSDFTTPNEVITPGVARMPLMPINDDTPPAVDNRKAPPPSQDPAPPTQLDYNQGTTLTQVTDGIEQQARQQLRQLRTEQDEFHRQANQPVTTANNLPLLPPNNPAPPPHNAGNNSQLLNLVKAPRIGGVYQGKEAWVGGSNLFFKRRQSPKGILCRRPMDLKQALVITKECQEGLISKYKLTAGDEKNLHNVKITDWIEHCRKAIELRGMDTVFRVLN